MEGLTWLWEIMFKGLLINSKRKQDLTRVKILMKKSIRELVGLPKAPTPRISFSGFLNFYTGSVMKSV